MAPKRGTKQAKIVNNEELYKNLALNDAVCPICRYILILPVTLPCNHNLCNACFQGTVANANLTCPLCRVRFASWMRIAKKDDKIVNHKLWLELQAQFGEQVQNRQNGIDDSFDEDQPVKITNTGEIRKEYQIQKQKQELELQRERDAEEKASADCISKIREEDALEDSLRVEKLRLDQKVAREIAQDIGIVPKFNNTPKKRPLDKLIQNMKLNAVPKADHKHDTTETELPQRKHVKAHSEPSTSGNTAEKSAKQKNLMNFIEVIEISDSNDSIENECRYFKPIDHRNIPPSSAVTPVKVPAVFSKHVNFKFESPNISDFQLQSNNTSAFARFVTQSRKRKISETSRQKIIKKLSLADPEKIYSSLKSRKEKDAVVINDKKLPHTMTLRDRKSSNASPTFNSSILPNMNNVNLQNSATNGELSHHDQEVEQLKQVRMEQEKTDLELAKKLQEKFNKERYTTRSSISCRNNIKKSRQLTLTEIMSTSKCK